MLTVKIMNRIKFIFLVACVFLISVTGASANEVTQPSTNLQKEIHFQLLELAVANFDKSYYRQYMRMRQSVGTPDYGTELAISYLMVRNFRNSIRSMSWEDIQNFHFRKHEQQFTTKEVDLYEESIRNGSLEHILRNLRPEIPNYLSYRHEMIEQLRSTASEVAPYPFRMLKEGSSGKEVNALKIALQKLGYLDVYSPINGDFDFELTEAVKKFQEDKGLKADGIVGKLSYDLIFKTHESKAVSIARTIIRMSDRELYRSPEYVFVNIPKMELNVYYSNKSVLESKVVVGRFDRQTPRLKSLIDNVVLNPTWTAPSTISEKDYLPKLRKDREYLTKKGLTMYYSGYEIDPNTLTAEDLTPSGIKKFRIVQKPGTGNAMGLYKFNFPNSDSIYLHSTNSPGKFRGASRMYSSGCVRVQKSDELAKYLLKDDLKPERVDKIIESAKTTWLKLSRKVPIYLAYWTSYIGENGQVYYLPDIYQIDSLDDRLPPDLLQSLK